MNTIDRFTSKEECGFVLLENGTTTSCLLFDRAAYIFKPSTSPYVMYMPNGKTQRFACMSGCCDAGLREDVRAIVAKAAACGAHKVVLQAGRGYYHFEMIAGLPVEDVHGHVGVLAPGLVISRG